MLKKGKALLAVREEPPRLTVHLYLMGPPLILLLSDGPCGESVQLNGV